jgi:hypothetical protein
MVLTLRDSGTTPWGLDGRDRAIGTHFWAYCPDILVTQGKMLGAITA